MDENAAGATDHLDRMVVADALSALPSWTGDATGLTRAVRVSGAAADKLLADVAELAASLGHDPDVERDDGTVRFVLTTHDAGGVTAVDIAMASRIDDLVAAATGVPADHPHHEPLESAEDS
jgi:4a-hydroxytetrahydrobiopterin dehydratase